MDGLRPSIYSREDERRMSELQGRVNCGESLSEEEALELAQLKGLYDDFIHEGERRLRLQGEPAADGAAETDSPGDMLLTLQETVTSAGKAAYFWGSLVATLVPGYFGRKVGLTSGFLHWNFITDRLLLGALPVVTKLGSSGNHLVQIREQLESRNQKLGLVIACLEEAEVNGFGVQMISFADESSWHAYVSPTVQYIRLPMPDTTANISFDSVWFAVQQIHKCIDERNCVVYLHCKAGKGRSWMVAMCYLTSYGGMTFDDAEQLIRLSRSQINPSAAQRAFAAKFAARIPMQRK
ncbi:dual specificity phosphatase [Trypanosoma conorhini]|uniref:Dual specificity phosphatase n=1 Tax=Trypanosoma conorhini TaxID=83891 RepID=A0A3R7LUU9_9TRYP|nr:dual specificity phosphatase [Trypanosoma conorhini]RNF21147.1 dual specificity phosphatase [Trypanosoma conorhini]